MTYGACAAQRKRLVAATVSTRDAQSRRLPARVDQI